MQSKGFSLLELLVTLLLLGILMAIAYPSYQYYLQRAHRQEAALCLIQLSVALARYHFKYHTYERASLASLSIATDVAGFYKISLDEQSQAHYSISAAPTFLDSACGVLSLNELQQKSTSGWSSVSLCWP